MPDDGVKASTRGNLAEARATPYDAAHEAAGEAAKRTATPSPVPQVASRRWLHLGLFLLLPLALLAVAITKPAPPLASVAPQVPTAVCAVVAWIFVARSRNRS